MLHSKKLETGNNFKLLADTGYFKALLYAITMIHKRPGFKKFLKKVHTGFEVSIDKIKFPKGVNRCMVIDRENNWYDETITNISTEKITRYKHEPLDQHISSRQKNDILL